MKRSSLIQQPNPVSKRLLFSNNDPDEQRKYEHLSLRQLFAHMKEMNAKLKMQKQQQHTTVAIDRQHNFLKVLCKDWKNLAKSFSKRKVRKHLRIC